MKTRRVAAELSHEGGRTEKRKDTTKVIPVLRNFAKAPKNYREVETTVTRWPTTQYAD